MLSQTEFEFGAKLREDGLTNFRFWAPSQGSVSIAIETGELIAMSHISNGWFEATAFAPVGTRYRYRLADGLMVPDPASAQQAMDLHDASVVVDHHYDWKNPDWRGRPWSSAVIYEVHAGTAGGFRGIRDDLLRLKSLGVTAIELMPINDFPGRRNWGYDGVLPYAPDSAYGTADELKELVDAAHGLGLMMFLDVVYNHFGPDGNYLHEYAPDFFCKDIQTPWGPAIDFHRPEVRDYFTNNVLMWLLDYRFDGLRFDAVHAIIEQDWVGEMAALVRRTIESSRHVHLILEHHNASSLLRQGIDAQWNDDGHNVLHVLLTDERSGYYADYVKDPAVMLARCLAEGWAYQGERSNHLGKRRGEPSADLAPTAHVLFLQNHDQVGNRALGERLTALADPQALEAAIALQLLCPQIPLVFMGEEIASTTPFLYFTDHNDELAAAVREGRRKEFAGFAAFADPAKRELIPDPNSEATFAASKPRPDLNRSDERFKLYQHLLAIRSETLVPRLPGTISLGARAIGPKAVIGSWLMGDGAILTVITNLGSSSIDFDTPPGRLLHESAAAAPFTRVYLVAAA
jgi:malto-oligosyltrehalose trehalohydrolase